MSKGKGMNRTVLLAALLALGFVGYMSIFTVFQTQQAIVLQFGNPKQIIREPGLHFKAPWQNVLYLDNRILNLDVHPQEVIASDQKRLVVDAFARFRIIDPLLTYQRVRTENGARQQLETVLGSNIRRTLGSEAFVTKRRGL